MPVGPRVCLARGARGARLSRVDGRRRLVERNTRSCAQARPRLRSQMINSRLNNTLDTSKAQALHTWMDPYLRCGTLRYTPRYRAHPDTHNRFSLSRRGVRRVAYRQARPSITRDPSRLGSGTEKTCLLAVRGPAWRFMHDAGKVWLGMARSGNRPPRPARHAHGGLRISRSS